MRTNKEILKQSIFSPLPANWFIHAQGFYQSGLKLVEAYEKLFPRENPCISAEEIYNKRYSYKIAIYLLAHSIELLLKCIVAIYNQRCPNKPLKYPQCYSHNIIKIVDDLGKVGIISVSEEDDEIFKLINEYLKWFGRYYCPNGKDIDSTIQEAYTEPDENGLVAFKYEIKYPETHQNISELYQGLKPNEAESSLGMMHYLLHTP